MRIATWNVNSIRARAERAVDVLKRWDLDVLLLQETKCKTEQFPADTFENAGYQVAAHGLNQWNGVAIISRQGLEDVRTSFPDQPPYAKKSSGGLLDAPQLEARALGARCGGIEVWSIYVPNGRSIDNPHYRYKLDFLAALHKAADSTLTGDPGASLLLGGDWNVAPRDEDVWDISAFANDIYVTDAERAAFNAFAEAGLTEVTRDAEGASYTFWDYQRLRFPRNEGMRIDFAWASPAVAKRVTAVHIDRNERKGKGASDHVPVIIELAD
ncbi:exodeoxyribonuclease III [Actinobaculum sp. 352]|uniref:exodeoxyribonuclease III n=1 Tax=Actinobaculum sp. 352 TaxID=2490946 RepID=UPI000F7F29E7|nr:exodeoxyribonuclease III [Actinobaculum sp. 352]RTE48510.1 exodeoxyribonuclease III [Actinobaculum sp. 352]